MNGKTKHTHLAEDPAQRKALSSPLRLEILGLFTTKDALSVAEMAQRMGRPVASLYYHVRILEQVGLLKQTGVRPSGPRRESLYRPIAERFAMPVDPDTGEGVADATRALTAAFRMAERDFEAAMRSTGVRKEGPSRNLFATRVHCRMDAESLRELNQHLRAIEKLLRQSARLTRSPEKGDQYLSLTLALLPLRGRHSD